MAVTRNVAAARQRVWVVLADGWTYSGWLAGNSRIRVVSSNWPAPGWRTCVPSGGWPTVIKDETTVESCVSGTCAAGEGTAGGRGADHDVAVHMPGGCRVDMARGRGLTATALDTRQPACPRSRTVPPTPTRPTVRRSSTAAPAPSTRGNRTDRFREHADRQHAGRTRLADPNLDAHRQTPPA
jgi:hypothetical protein